MEETILNALSERFGFGTITSGQRKPDPLVEAAAARVVDAIVNPQNGGDGE